MSQNVPAQTNVKPAYSISRTGLNKLPVSSNLVQIVSTELDLI